jgi:hypothetical protein
VKDAQKPDHVSLTTLVSRLKEGRFVIPDFQRDFEWTPWDIAELMRSIFLDYYIGSLLLWKGKNENFQALACEPVYGYTSNGASPEHIVLDGQQRLTAMYYCFMAPDVSAPNRANRFLYFIRVDRFMAGAYDEAFEYDWTQRGRKLLAQPALQYSEHSFPLAVIGRGGWDLYNWVHGYEAYWQGKATSAEEAGDADAADVARQFADDAREFGEHLKGIIEQYQIAYIELDRDLELDKVCDIFTQINSRGIRLDVFDLVNALLKPKGLQLKHMWREAAPRLDFVDTQRMNVYVLQVMSILRQAYCSPKYLYYLLPGQEKAVREPDGSLRKEVLVPGTAEFRSRWDQAVQALADAISLLRHPQEFGAISSQYLPYVSILPVFAALQHEVGLLPAHMRLDAQRKVRHWYWASVFTSRYSGSVESTAAKDYQDVKAWLADDGAEPALLAEFEARFRNLELRRETKRGTSVYNGIFNLLVLKGARDWMTGNVPQHGDLDDHHIVPRDWGKAHSEIGTSIDTILNRTPLTADTNRHVISDRLPNAYLPELIASNGESAVRATLESHFISSAPFDILLRDPFTPDDFDAFLAERQRTIQAAIEDLLIKERLDLEPRLRELDQEVEQVELGLRTLVAQGLADDVARVPSHVREKAAERVQAKARKNPAFTPDGHLVLPGILEFFDLRELQDTITNKLLWPEFEGRFGNKETLAAKFGQLAELRNALRHTRTVDEVTRKEGEAAVLWFKQLGVG